MNVFLCKYFLEKVGITKDNVAFSLLLTFLCVRFAKKDANAIQLCTKECQIVFGGGKF